MNVDVSVQDFLSTFINGHFVELRAVYRSKDQKRSTPQEFFATGRFASISDFIQRYGADYNIYFGVAERASTDSGGLENCSAVHALWADIDFKNTPEEEARSALSIFPLQPSVRILTGGGLHVYWLLARPYDLSSADQAAHFKNLLRRIAHALAADLTSAEPAHVLRIPGTFNYKYDPPRVVTVKHFDPEARFTIDDFEFLPESPEEIRERAQADESHGNGQGTPDEERFAVMLRFGQYLKQTPGAIEHDHGDNQTFRVAATGYHDFGLSPSDVFSVMWPWNQEKCRPPWSGEELRDKIANAASYGSHTRGEKRDAPPRNDPNGGTSKPGGAASSFVTPSHWKRLDVADVATWKCAPLRPIVDGILARGNFVFMAAQSQAGKTLLMLHTLRAILERGKVFGKYEITPVARVAYLLLEDPDRRAQERILDVQHEFQTLDKERFIIHVSPGFQLNHDGMFQWMEDIIVGECREVIVIDTYQKATPGIASFDDEKQGLLLHKLSNLTRRLDVTIIINDHFRKEPNARGKRRELTLDDLKGTGGKAQNADCVILADRTPDRKHMRFEVLSKDFDSPIRILVSVSPKGSPGPKFTYVADLETLGQSSHERAEERKKNVLDAMKPGEWMKTSDVAAAAKITEHTARRILKSLLDAKLIDAAGKGKAIRYSRAAENRDK